MVNPALQPSHLAERYQNVVSLVVTGLEGDTYLFDVQEVLKGDFAPAKLRLKLPPSDEEDPETGMPGAPPVTLNDGDLVTAFAGRVRKRGADELLLYAGNRTWHEGRIPDPEKPGEWEWTAQSPEAMSGTWNGNSRQLVEIIRHFQANELFFPAQAHTRFREDLVIASYEGAVRGTGIHDLNADGRADILACTPDGVRIFLQGDDLAFRDATADFGLGGVNAASLSVADVNADGRTDLLLDATIYLWNEGRYVKSALLPEIDVASVQAATFADINGNGYPDAVVSVKKGGLRLFLNPGATGGAFKEATSEAGLREDLARPDGTGYFAVGDWTGNGRADLFYGPGRAIILQQGDDGRFTPAPGRLQIDLRDTTQFEEGLTGAAAFAPLWTEERFDIAIPTDSRMALLTRLDDQPAEVSGQGNEVGVVPSALWATVAEDLNANGHVDLFSLTRQETGSSNVFHLNRGYGSYMFPERYGQVFSGGFYTVGAGGAAAGDVTGDGANDLVIGGLDGRLVLSVNDSLALRTPLEHPTREEAVLRTIRLLTIVPQGNQGVLGAVITVIAPGGQVVARRQIGTGMPVGSSGPFATNLAIRQHGEYLVKVRYSDGLEREKRVTIGPEERQVLSIGRE